MTAKPRPAAAYLSALLALLPRGRVWPRDPDSVLVRSLSGLAPVYERSDSQACNLLVDAFPSTAVQLLPEWESTLGLPDPCLGPAPTIAARQAVVVAKLTSRGGQSPAYFVRLAKELGFDVTVQEYAPAHAGSARCGQPALGIAWAHAWSVTSALGPITTATCGVSHCGDPLRSWANVLLECQLRETEPAHARLFFLYSPQGLDYDFILDVSEMS